MATKRIQLLSGYEIADIYNRPDFNNDERELYFSINDKRELDLLNQYSNIKTRVYFILQIGYFKAKQQFYKFNLEDVITDAKYGVCVVTPKKVSLLEIKNNN